jgi:uncharacterized protein (TIGR03067 family)
MKLRGLLVLSVGLLLAADTKEDAIIKTRTKLIGVWNVSAYEAMGAKDPALSQQLKVLFTEKDMVVQQKDNENKSGYTLDPTTKPMQINLVPASGPNMDKNLPGIFELDGDNLKVIWNDKGLGRPKEFKTAEDSGNVMLILKRQAK